MPIVPSCVPQWELARLTGGTLLIAKLDKLSRNAAFLLGLEKAGVNFVAVDMPGDAGRGLSLRAMAVELTAEDIMTARGGAWTATAVKNLLARQV